MKVSGLDHLVLHVRDMARAKKFYVDVLGMTIERENSSQTFMHCGSQGVALFEVKDSEFLPGHDLNHLALVVDEGTRESIKETLEQAGTTVEGRDTDPTCVYFDDPDGHRIQILYPGFRAFTSNAMGRRRSGLACRDPTLPGTVHLAN